MSQSDTSWNFIHWHPAPGVPAVDIAMLSAPAEPQSEPGPCPQCRGTGRGTGSDEYGWFKCEGCSGSGQIGGGL